MRPITKGMAKSAIERIQGKVKTIPSGCQEWQGSTNNMGYGMISILGRPYLVHRVVFTYVYGYLEGLLVCHRCDNPKCINPSHLFAGSQSENLLDAKKKNRLNRPKGDLHSGTKLLAKDAKTIAKIYIPGDPKYGARALARILKVDHKTIISAIKRVRSG